MTIPAWLIWLAIAGVLGTAEIITLTFAAGLVALAAVMAAIVAGVGGNLEMQSVIFATTSFGSLAAVLPVVRRRAATRRGYRSGVDALLGRPALTLTQVDAVCGTVRIGGEIWSARTYDESQVIAEGTRVSVYEIDGATALIYPREFA